MVEAPWGVYRSMSIVGSYQLERIEGQEHWRAVVVFGADAAKPCTGPSERFELGEPVHTSEPFLKRKSNKGRVFWITRITSDEENDDAQIWLNFTRYGGHGDLSVSPTRLRKLPAMLRLAVEAKE